MLNNAAARLYAARWALKDDDARAELAPKGLSALGRALLLHVPLWLPKWVLTLLSSAFGVPSRLPGREGVFSAGSWSVVVIWCPRLCWS